MDDAEYRLWDLIGACTTWDSSKTTYRTLGATQLSLAEVLGWSASKTSRRLHGLHSKGLITVIEEGVYEVHHLPDQQLISREVAGVQVSQPVVQRGVALAGEVVAPVQQSPPQMTETPLGAFKVNVGLDESDMRWMDENVK